MKPTSTKLVLAIAYSCCSQSQASAQGQIVSMNTSQGQTLATQQRTLATDVSSGPLFLQFNFGFATAESFRPATLLDSLTVTLQSADSLSTAIYLTMDASGLVLAPASPGTVRLDSSSIQTKPIDYPSLQPVLPTRSAYQVLATIPVEFKGQPVNVFFDLYDNQDALPSQAWFSDLRVVAVPEPGVAALAGLALLVVTAASRARWRRR